MEEAKNNKREKESCKARERNKAERNESKGRKRKLKAESEGRTEGRLGRAAGRARGLCGTRSRSRAEGAAPVPPGQRPQSPAEPRGQARGWCRADKTNPGCGTPRHRGGTAVEGRRRGKKEEKKNKIKETRGTNKPTNQQTKKAWGKKERKGRR